MKIAIYSPYLDTAGGGEKYMFTIAETLSVKCDVDILLDKHLIDIGVDSIKERLEKLHDFDLSNMHFIYAPIGMGSSFWKRLVFLGKYDVMFYLTDGSVFFSTAKKNIIHFQSPLKNYKKDLWALIKLKSWSKAIFNSKFTKTLIEEEWSVNGAVVYPPVDITKLEVGEKTKEIISVGRFDKSKKHEVLISAFKDMVKDKETLGWELNLVGGLREADKEYLQQLKDQARGFSINFYPNATVEKLHNLYSTSSIYWHAAGFGETNPQYYEHFGITTVEAMAAGCVPVVISRGGQLEIVDNDINGLLWSSIESLIEKTIMLIKDPRQIKRMSEKAVEKSKLFSKQRFIEEINKIVYG